MFAQGYILIIPTMPWRWRAAGFRIRWWYVGTCLISVCARRIRGLCFRWWTAFSLCGRGCRWRIWCRFVLGVRSFGSMFVAAILLIFCPCVIVWSRWRGLMLWWTIFRDMAGIRWLIFLFMVLRC